MNEQVIKNYKLTLTVQCCNDIEAIEKASIVAKASNEYIYIDDQFIISPNLDVLTTKKCKGKDSV